MRVFQALGFASPLFIFGCAIHPLPEDVSKLNTVDIVQQIRCEAREAMKAHAFPENYKTPSEKEVDIAAAQAKQTARLQTIFSHLNSITEKNIEILHNDVFVRTRNIPNIQSTAEFENILKYSSKIARNACELDDRRRCQAPNDKTKLRAVAAEKTPALGSLRSKIIKFINLNYIDNKCIAREFTEMDDRLIDIANNIDGIDVRDLNLDYISEVRREILQEINCFRYKNQFYQMSINTGIDTFTTSGYLPDKNTHRNLRTDLLAWCNNVMDRMQCKSGVRAIHDELQAKEKADQRVSFANTNLKKEYKRLKDVAIGYDFEFKITDQDKSGVGLDFSIPFSTGSFSLGSSISEEKKRFSTRTFKLAENVDHLLADDGSCILSNSNWKYPITGAIGIDETVKTYLNLTNMPHFKKNTEAKNADSSVQPKSTTSSKENEFTDKLEFTTEIIGSLAPTLSLNPIPNSFRLVKATPSIGKTRTDVHSVTISFAKAERLEFEAPAVEFFPEGFPPELGSGPLSEKTARVTCRGSLCTLKETGTQLNFVPPTDNFQGTIRCTAEDCSIQSDLPAGESAVDKALDVLERRRSEESLRDVIREELSQ